jgi:MurNAc alpha-1-phosphate uridylyltransferase
MNITTAVILAAGLGTRLGPLTQETPKCLVPICGRPVLEWVIRKLANQGVRKIFVNTHHFAERVETFLMQKNFFDLEIIISREDELLDTGGALAQMKPELVKSKNFYLHNADILSAIHLQELVSAHNRPGAVATLATQVSDDARCFLFDKQNALIGWENRTTGSQRVIRKEEHFAFGFCGVSLLNSAIFDFFPPEKKFSIVDAWLAAAAQSSSAVKAHRVSPDLFFDIGTPEQLAASQATFSAVGVQTIL